MEGTPRLVLVTGGARSGKSSYAEKLAFELGGDAVTYIATAETFDDEMRERVRRHREQRPKAWQTVEAPRGIVEAVREAGHRSKAILIDCLTVYVSNRLLAGIPDGLILAEVEELGRVAREVPACVIIVTNEVGDGVVPAYELGRHFRDLAGWANQAMGRHADEVYLSVCGIPLALKALSRGATGLAAVAADIAAPPIVALAPPPTTCKPVMLQGTSSHVGKSVLCAALCRILVQDGYRVAPFKSQNMALNSAVTADGLEMGRAQAVQAEAAGLPPSVLMNPILIKPTRDSAAQIVVMGKPLAEMTAMEYRKEYVKRGLVVVQEALNQLMRDYQVLVIEGAGSPAEVNLKSGDIVNMRIAKLADAPVLLVADVDKGGCMAAVVGTLSLLDADERDRVKGIIINMFRGDIRLFEDAVTFLEGYTGKPVLGVIPYLKDIGVDEEDSVALDRGESSAPPGAGADSVRIAAIRLPRVSNFTDFDSLRREPGVELQFVTSPGAVREADCVIIPGTKETVADLEWLRHSGLADALNSFEGPIVGICGGYQILGQTMAEGTTATQGLGLLPLHTEFEPEKVTQQVTAIATNGPGGTLTGYEIHMGRTSILPGGDQGAPLLRILSRSGEPADDMDGWVSHDGRVWGTYLHGIFDNDGFRRSFVNGLRAAKGLSPLTDEQPGEGARREAVYNRLASHVRAHIDMEKLYSIMGLS